MSNFRSEDFELSWSWKSVPPFALGSSLKIEVSVNVRSNYDLKDCYFFMGNTRYFASTLEYLNHGRSVIMTLKPWETSNVLTLDLIKISLMNPQGKELNYIRPHWEMCNFTAELFPPSVKVSGRDQLTNILLFGLMGSSKSSFINSCYTLLRSQKTQLASDIAVAGGNTGHVTTTLKGYRLCDIDTKKPTPYRLWDTWGLDRKNYSDNEFEAILGGQVYRDFKMNESMFPLEFNQNRIHCVIFFIPIGEVSIDMSDLLPRTQSFIERATREGVRSVIALSKVDSICPKFRTNSSVIPSEIQTPLNKLSSTLNIPQNRIIPLVNYQNETAKSFEVDRAVFSVLSAATRATEGCVIDQEITDLINS